MKRASGVLMHISSLPGEYSTGSFGDEAKEFIDFLKDCGFTYWQVLPFCMIDECNSPYKSYSAFGGNPYFINLDKLMQQGLVSKEELEGYRQQTPYSCEFVRLYHTRFELLKTISSRVSAQQRQTIEEFISGRKYLDDCCRFMALKAANDNKCWIDWKNSDIDSDILFMWKFIQYEFFMQWTELKVYANQNDIKIIGDIPIFVAYDSCDVWANKEQFLLDSDYRPSCVAGVPPDYFAKDGQLWGNPLFNWDYMKETGYQWWVNRIAYQSKIYDVIRIDHFRGFDEYYAIPYGDSTAKNGHWKPGPGMDLFTTIENKLGKLPIIAEDLGFLTDSVKQLLAATGFPGMKVLEFAFDSRDTGSGYLPHCYPNNCVVYTGTHDNDTILGWFETAPEEFQNNAIRYLRLTKEEGYHIGMMRCAWASVADTAIMQMQDFLGLGVEGRMNTPSTLGGNWTWRCLPGDYNNELADWIYEETKIYDRLN